MFSFSENTSNIFLASIYNSVDDLWLSLDAGVHYWSDNYQDVIVFRDSQFMLDTMHKIFQEGLVTQAEISQGSILIVPIIQMTVDVYLKTVDHVYDFTQSSTFPQSTMWMKIYKRASIP